MVDAVSLSGNSYRAVSRVLETRALAPSAESRPAESALAALSLPQPVTRVTAPSDTAEEAGDLGFLYTPAGLPAASALPAYAVPAADAAAARSRSGTARLAVDSSELNTLLSSFLTAFGVGVVVGR